MDREELSQRLMRSFLGEAEDRIEALNTDLLALEQADEASRSSLIQRLFRSAHSLKGAARAVGYASIETICHRMEEVMARVRDGERPLDAPLAELLFKTVDAVQSATAHLQGGAPEDPSLVAPVIASLDEALGQAQAPPQQQPPPPPPPPRNGDGAPPSQTNGKPPPPPQVPVIDETPVEEEPTAAPQPAAEGLETLRVATEKLKGLLNESGELLLAHRRVDGDVRALADVAENVKRFEATWRRGLQDGSADAQTQLHQLIQNLDHVVDDLLRDERALGRVAGRLNRTAQEVRMTSFTSACRGLARAARDVAAAEGKRVELQLRGGDVELDRLVVERLRDPLLHLVRNAVSHGIEEPADRTAHGKPSTGSVTLSAELRGDTVQVTVQDDGRGIDVQALRARAAQLGLAVPDDERAVEQIVFHAGFSTTETANRVTGRGVGLDVVKTEVEALHGSIALNADHGTGCCFTLTVPLTLTAIHALLVRCGGRDFALPSATVSGLRRVRMDEAVTLPSGPALQHREHLVPLRRLAEMLGKGGAASTSPDGCVAVAVVGNPGAEVALIVDALLAETEILIKDLGTRLQGIELISGATILESGQVALTLNAPALARRAEGATFGTAALQASAAKGGATEDAARKRLLVVDDSVTTRMLLTGVLEEAGYEVAAAPDGVSAWERLQRDSFDLVVSDVEMPRMDGFGLTERIRASAGHREMPMILVTGMEKEEHRLRGLAAGANAYLVKSGFENESLLDAIGEFL